MQKIRIYAVCSAFFLSLFLSACGSKAQEASSVVNYTLPDVGSFNEAYTSDREEQQAAVTSAAQAYRWNPHGVFTLNVVGNNGDWAAGFVNISSVDISTHTAVLTYSIKDSYGYSLAQTGGGSPAEKDYFFDSDGELVTGADETEDADGTRHVIIYMPDDHWLEFSGKEKLTSAKYHYNDLYYGLKREG